MFNSNSPYFIRYIYAHYFESLYSKNLPDYESYQRMINKMIEDKKKN